MPESNLFTGCESWKIWEISESDFTNPKETILARFEARWKVPVEVFLILSEQSLGFFLHGTRNAVNKPLSL